MDPIDYGDKKSHSTQEAASRGGQTALPRTGMNPFPLVTDADTQKIPLSWRGGSRSEMGWSGGRFGNLKSVKKRRKPLPPPAAVPLP